VMGNDTNDARLVRGVGGEKAGFFWFGFEWIRRGRDGEKKARIARIAKIAKDRAVQGEATRCRQDVDVASRD
jgi:hypothetical protein